MRKSGRNTASLNAKASSRRAEANQGGQLPRGGEEQEPHLGRPQHGRQDRHPRDPEPDGGEEEGAGGGEEDPDGEVLGGGDRGG